MKTKQRITYCVLLLILTAAFLFFSSTTSPFYPNTYGVDSAFNRFMGLMVRRGKTLYSGIWDNKGPVLFFLQAFGTLKGTRNAEVTLTFLMQIASMVLTVFFLCLADREVNRRGMLRTVLFVCCGLAVFCKVMEGGNLSEEWSLPMIACSLFLFVKYAANAADHPLHQRRYAFIHGVCFGLIAMIRVNNAVSICAGVFGIAVYLISRKKWRNLWENLLFGLLGAALVIVPIFIYFAAKHALSDMLYAVFFYNLKYAAQRTHKTFTGTALLDRFLPMAASLLIIFVHLIRTRTFRLADGIMLLIVCANSAMLWSSNVFLHYYIIYVPVFVTVLFLYADLRRIPEMAAALAVLAFFIAEDIPLLADFSAAGDMPDRFAFAASIPEDEKQSAMGLYVSPEVYLNSGLIPCSRYAAYHFAHFPVDPSMKAEFLDDLRSDPPYWIIYLSGYEGIIPEVQELLDERYEWVTEEYDTAYYRLKR